MASRRLAGGPWPRNGVGESCRGRLNFEQAMASPARPGIAAPRFLRIPAGCVHGIRPRLPARHSRERGHPDGNPGDPRRRFGGASSTPRTCIAAISELNAFLDDLLVLMLSQVVSHTEVWIPFEVEMGDFCQKELPQVGGTR